MNQVAAVVVTYNRLELLKECIEKLLAQTSSCDVLIVDNASSDGTEVYIKNTYANNTRIHYRNTGANIGGAVGFNVGMRWAVEAGYEFVWVMDDDCMPREDALEKLLDADKILQGNYGWLSSVVLWKDGHECKMNRPKYKSRKTTSILNIAEAMQASFVSLFVSSITIVKYGLPIKEFFIWGDDIEYTRRLAIRNKLHCFIVRDSIVIHKMIFNCGSSIATDSLERLDRYILAYRNEFYLYKLEGLNGTIYYMLKVSYNIAKIILSKNKFLRLHAIMQGVIQGYQFNPKIEMIG